MSLHDKNRMFCILHKNKVNRKNIEIIMNDLKESGIFDDEETTEDGDDFYFEDTESSAVIDESIPSEREELFKFLKTNHENEFFNIMRNQHLHASESRIQSKIKEMEEKGLRGSFYDDEEDKDDRNMKERRQNQSNITRYGRSPLHEAIALRNIRLVKKYVKEGLYTGDIDNNGHTPMEMAFYEGFKEAMIVFKTFHRKK